MNRQIKIIEQEDLTMQQLDKLREKYARENQSIFCHLERIYHEKTLDYTDYLGIDTLLTLQKPKTNFPDETIFIVYHQIVELYFRLILWELEQLTDPNDPKPADLFIEKVKRVNRYFNCVISSFDIMANGLDKVQFLKFRYALFPASGFQSFQYRKIEMCATDAINLVNRKWLPYIKNTEEMEELYERTYWKRGAVENDTGGKSVTLTDFERKYDTKLLQHLKDYQGRNLYQMYQNHIEGTAAEEEARKVLREFDQAANIRWQLAHYKVAMKHLTSKKKTTVKSTGGTNWRKYLNPRFQMISFFPKLWSSSEMEQWGHID